ncbi:unnamed protein product [Euphydryas editha]|uniref:Uncharacterized protein n=1 Tax=Euphydryas editha TaxID=104508 RepID=A0AAU9TYU6_EUPED|nr:unnamed protein product [Euphydryas editha]
MFICWITLYASDSTARRGAARCGAEQRSGRLGGRRRNATGNRFQEGRGPLPCRISPAVKRADKCGGHLRQHRAMHRPPPRSAAVAAFQTTLS